MSYARAQKLRDSEGSGVQWLICNEWGLSNERLLLLSEIDSALGDTRVFRGLKNSKSEQRAGFNGEKNKAEIEIQLALQWASPHAMPGAQLDSRGSAESRQSGGLATTYISESQSSLVLGDGLERV